MRYRLKHLLLKNIKKISKLKHSELFNKVKINYG